MSFTLNYTGDEINAILARANNGGEIDNELALKAPLASPALTGNPTAPTQPEEDNSTKVATTEYADRAADAAGAAAEAAAKEYTDAATGALYITDTASGPIASFSDGADGIPMRSVVVNIAPVQSGSGDPSPDNVRPISGWTGAEVTRTGKNLFDGGYEVAYLENGTTWRTNNSNTRTAVVRVEGGITYTVSKNGGDRFVICEASELPVAGTAYTQLFNIASATTATVTPSASAKYLLIYVSQNSTEPQMQVELGSAATDYEPYAGQTFPVTWESQAGEVFGGTIDVVSGELTVDSAIYPTNLTTRHWEIVSGNGPDYFQTTNLNVDLNRRTQMICNKYKTLVPSAMNRGDFIAGITATKDLRVRDSRYTTVNDFKNSLSDAVFVCPLATPQTYQLSPQQITSLLGQNNVWSNTGDTEVTYVADPKLYIAKMLGDSTLTLGSASPLSANRPVTISEEDLEQAGEVSEAVEAAAETVLPAESGETEEGAQE